MKIIVSRKGFDSTAGGVPSPILPDGRLVSLPIPDRHSPIRYGEIGDAGRNIGSLVSRLTRGRIRRNSRAHLDPDLVSGDLPRQRQWRPLFGQAGAAQGHLHRQGVGPGDLFVFFGLFRATRICSGRLVWVPGAPRRHIFWGWLQISDVVAVDDCPDSVREWAGYHPHFGRTPDGSNTLYIARRQLALPGCCHHALAGAGVFNQFSERLALTDPRADRPSRWRLPQWMYPRDGVVPLTYHAGAGRWSRGPDGVGLRSVARGQEFVLDTNDYPEAMNWARTLIESQAGQRLY